MEKVLEVYKRPYDKKRPVICMDESPKQLIGETKTPIAAQPGSEEKYDYEYVRNGVCNIFMSNARFHASGGVFPQTVLCGFGSLSPARTFVELVH